MNSYKVKGIILAVIISLASIMMPFSVYADSISLSNINGVSVTLDEITFIENVQYNVSGGTLTVQRNFFTYQAEIQFDKSYLGYVDISYKYYFTGRNDTGLVSYNQTKNQKIFVNGDKAYFTFSFIANSSVDPLSYTTSYLTLNSSDLTEYGLLSDIETIIDILTENQDIINDIYSELQTVVSNTSLANDYLETISLLRQYDIKIESIPYVYQFCKTYSSLISNTYFDNYYFNYPIFNITSSTNIFYGRLNNEYNHILIFGMDKLMNNYYSSISQVLRIEYDGNAIDTSYFQFERLSASNNDQINIYKIKFNIMGTSNLLVRPKQNCYFIPIYCGNDNGLYSSDFALQYGLSNELINNVRLIANGTNQSNSAASSLENEAAEYSDITDDVIGVEEGLTSNFETEVNKIDLDTGLNVFGGNFMTSATWVRTQFDRLTENTPYGSLVVYGLTLGFALLMLGKVFL